MCLHFFFCNKQKKYCVRANLNEIFLFFIINSLNKWVSPLHIILSIHTLKHIYFIYIFYVVLLRRYAQENIFFFAYPVPLLVVDAYYINHMSIKFYINYLLLACLFFTTIFVSRIEQAEYFYY